MVLFVTLFLLIPAYAMAYTTGRVVDFFTGKPIKDAFVTSNNDVVLTDENGIFTVNAALSKVGVRAPGYGRTEQIVIPLNGVPQEIKLIPFTPKALYLSFFGIGDRSLRESAIKLIQQTELNTLAIDVKGDRGMIPYKSSIPLAAEVGAQRTITVKEMAPLMRSLKAKGIYTIARIVVFKDNLLAQARPDWAVKTPGGRYGAIEKTWPGWILSISRYGIIILILPWKQPNMDLMRYSSTMSGFRMPRAFNFQCPIQRKTG